MNPSVPPRWENVRAGILTAHLTRSGGGVYTSVRQFARLLDEEPGIEVDVFGPAAKGSDLGEWDPLKPRTGGIVGPVFFSCSPGLEHRLASADLDLVHLHGLWLHTSMASLAFTKRTGKPHMVSPHGMLDAWALQNSGWKKRLAARLFENANIGTAAALHALNVAEVAAIREQGYAGPICVIPNGVDIPPAAEEPPPAPWWAAGQQETRTLLYLGRLHPKKGLPNLLLAWARLGSDIRKQWRLMIGGWDEHGHKLELRRMAASLHIEASVTFPGPLYGETKRAAYHYCHGFILPSLSEGLPMVVLEAWAAGRPVLMTPQCNLPEGFQADAALRIEPQQDSILEGLRHFIALGDAGRGEIGARGRDLAGRRFAWPVIAAEMAAVYRWLAGRGEKPGTVIQ